MRLIDKDVLIKAIDEGFVMTSEDIEGMTEVKAIPIRWMQRAIVDLLYDGYVKEEDRTILNGLIDRWEKQNEINRRNDSRNN